MLLLLLACNDTTEEQSTAHVHNALSAEDLGFAVEEASLSLLSIDPQIHHNAWAQAMTDYSDETCPPMEEHNGMDLWRESCTTASGNQFLGWTLRFVIQDEYFFEEEYFLTDYYWLSGQAQIISQDGIQIQNFGDILHKKGITIDERPWFQGFVYGDFTWNASDAENTWLQSPLTMEYYYTFAGIHDNLQIDIQAWLGGVSTNAPGAIFETLLFDTAVCPDEPLSGSIWIRDQYGTWQDVQYNGLDSCDGCGTITVEPSETTDASTTEVCSDFTMWSSWDVEPWEER